MGCLFLKQKVHGRGERERSYPQGERTTKRETEREAKWRKRERLLGERRGASVYSRGQVVVVGTRGYS